MTKTGYDLATVERQISNLRLEVRKGILDGLTKLDWEAPEILPWTIQQFIQSDFKPAILADRLSTTPSSISRWAQGQRLPPSPITREGMIARLYKLLAHEIEQSQHKYPCTKPSISADLESLPNGAIDETITPQDDS